MVGSPTMCLAADRPAFRPRGAAFGPAAPAPEGQGQMRPDRLVGQHEERAVGHGHEDTVLERGRERDRVDGLAKCEPLPVPRAGDLDLRSDGLRKPTVLIQRRTVPPPRHLPFPGQSLHQDVQRTQAPQTCRLQGTAVDDQTASGTGVRISRSRTRGPPRYPTCVRRCEIRRHLETTGARR